MDQRRDAGHDQEHEHRDRVDEDLQLGVDAGARRRSSRASRHLAVLARWPSSDDQRADRADERERRSRPSRSPRRPGRAACSRGRSIDRAEQREQQDQPAPGRRTRRLIRCSSCSSSTSTGRLRRLIATIRPSPTVTSQAATTITISANTWPASPPCMRANATSARLPALSISSRHSRITSGLRRISTPLRRCRRSAPRPSGTSRCSPVVLRPRRRSRRLVGVLVLLVASQRLLDMHSHPARLCERGDHRANAGALGHRA